MNINLEFYKVFCKVAEEGNISKAAEKLYISQPAVTNTIKKLENDLGGLLFYRKNNGVTLTEEGKHLYHYIKDSIDTINNAEDKFNQYKNIETGMIRIRTGSNNAKKVLYKPLIKFAQDYPNIKIDISAGKPDDSMKMLSLGKIDMVILNMPYESRYNNIEFQEIEDNEYIFVMTPEYKNKNNVKVNKMEDLNNYSLILPKEGSTARNILNQYLETQLVSWNYETISEEMRKDFAVSNLGIAYVMKSLVRKELEKGELIELKKIKKTSKVKIGIAILKEDISSFATKELVKYMKS